VWSISLAHSYANLKYALRCPWLHQRELCYHRANGTTRDSWKTSCLTCPPTVIDCTRFAHDEASITRLRSGLCHTSAPILPRMLHKLKKRSSRSLNSPPPHTHSSIDNIGNAEDHRRISICLFNPMKQLNDVSAARRQRYTQLL
jgi:hypothetical protein